MLPLHQRDVCWNRQTRTINLPRIRRMLSPLSYIPMLSDKQDSNLRAPHPKCGEIDLTPLLSVIVNPNGLEPLTPSLKVRCSNQLSYEFILWRKLVTLQLLWIFSPLLLLSQLLLLLSACRWTRTTELRREEIYSLQQLPLCDTG